VTPTRADWRYLDRLQRDTFQYFWKEANRANGLVPDNTRRGAPSSIAAVGMALSSYAVGVERGFVSRRQGARRCATTLRFFAASAQGAEPDATGYRGFYYHFLELESGRRMGKCELSTIDTAILLAGALTAAAYFDGSAAEEREIRQLADELHRRAEWDWALNGGEAVSHGWRPERGFIRYRWQGYNEALILYVLGLGSPTHPLPERSYAAWAETYVWKKLYGYELLYGAPMFMHQMSHLWIDFRGIQDEFMRRRGIDYFENSRRATYVQREYAIRNPRRFVGYGPECWGITAADGPGPASRRVCGVHRRFYAYKARGVPYGPDDGTLSPWAAAASLPFAPEIVLPTLRHFDRAYPQMVSHYGFKCSFNPTFRTRDTNGWVSSGYYGLDQGPIVLMIENQRSELLWRLMRGCSSVERGLRRAGFAGGWLGSRADSGGR
jgi:hypothetical protein